MKQSHKKGSVFVALGVLILLAGILQRLSPAFLAYSGACLLIAGTIMLKFRNMISDGVEARVIKGLSLLRLTPRAVSISGIGFTVLGVIVIFQYR